MAAANRFCYKCGKYGIHTKNVDELLTFKQYYELFYKIPVTNLDKPRVPSVVCQTCYQRLMDWGAKRRDGATNFNRPRIWSEPSNHYDDCFFCMVDVDTFNKRKRKGGDNVDYPDIPSSQAPRFEIDVNPTVRDQMPQASIASSQESTSSIFEPEKSEKELCLVE